MSGIRGFILRVVPRSMAASMEAESREWMLRCACGFERSIWDLGGLRWKASGNPKRRARCPQCGQVGMHTIHRREGAAS